MGKRIYNTEIFVEKCKQLHNNYYLYDDTNYVKYKEVVTIICPKHGRFTQTPECHLRGQGCPICGNINTAINESSTTEVFVEKAKLIHGDFYSYDNTIYVKAKDKVIITCPEHGDFLQTPDQHLHGHGCIKCGNRGNAFGFTKRGFVKSCQDNKSLLYIVNLSNNNELFTKIGITSRSIVERNIASKFYDKSIILSIENVPDKIWDLEKHLHTELKIFQYKPLIKFCGYTECFTLEALNHIPELLQNNPIIKINESISN